MSKYVHVNGDDETVTVADTIDENWYGWVYEVPEDLTLPLDKLNGWSTISDVIGSMGFRIVKEH